MRLYFHLPNVAPRPRRVVLKCLVQTIALLTSSVTVAIADPLTVPVSASGTYLFVDQGPPGYDVASPATTISLSQLNFYSNIPIKNQYVGLFAQGSFQYINYPPDFVYNASLGAVFSSSVSGFIAPGSGSNVAPFVSLPTYQANIPTDIPQDFLVPSGGFNNFAAARVPSGASKLSFTVNDSYFSDNTSINLNVTAFTLKDAVDDGDLAVSPNTAPSGALKGAITATYTPGLTLSAQDMAELGGYVHFNWLQIITSFSYDGKVTNDFAPFGETVRATGVDPLLGVDGADNTAPYWDEGNYIRPGFGDYNWADHEEPLQFIDMPNLLVAGWSANFSTYLIGVKADGTYDILANTLDDPDLAFRWQYTQLSDSGGNVAYQNIDPALAGGGDVTFLGYGGAIPEPSTWAMMLLGFACLGFAAHRMKPKGGAPFSPAA